MPKKGKKGVDQRVKGNVKSANSQRMAELIGGDVGGVIGFDAISSVSDDNLSSNNMGEGQVGVSSSSSSEVLYGDSSRFQVVLKQLGKRDPTTKNKALQEFKVLAQQLPPAATVGVLSLWCLMYNKLSMDNDNKVRENAHRALKSVVEAVKGSLGSHLRSIVGCWVAGMSDPHATAANSAYMAFGAAFPEEQKQREVYEFCFKAIVTHVTEMVVKNTPDTFSDPKVIPQDERVQKFERAQVMAVSSLRTLFSHVSADFLREKAKAWEDLMGDKRLWKLARHQNTALRAAVFSVVPLLCQKAAGFVQSKGRQCSSTVFSSLAESDPTVVGPLWEATVMIVAKTETWSGSVSVERALLPGMWSLFAAGGYGSARVIYPCLLPLLSRLLEKVYSADYQFAKDYLTKLGGGLQLDMPHTTRDEFEVLIRTFNECLLFLVTNMQLSKHYTNMFIKHAMTMVTEVLNTSLRPGPSQMQCEVIFSHSVKLIGKLLKLQDKIAQLRPCLTNFQLQISKNIADSLEAKEDVENNFAKVGSLLKCIFSRSLWNTMQRRTVRFASNPEITVRQLIGASADSSYLTSVGKEEEDQVDNAVRDFIAPTICCLCSNSIAAVSGSVDPNHSQLLLTMVRLYGNSTLVKSVFSSLDSNHPNLIREYRGEKVLKKKLLVICTVLFKAARLEAGLIEHPVFTENVMESCLLLLKCDLVDTASASSLLCELVKTSLGALSLILVKLNETDQKELLQSVVEACRDDCDCLLTNISVTENEFLWRLLEVLFAKSTATDSHFQELDLATFFFGTTCQLLTKALQQTDARGEGGGEGERDGRLSSDILKKMFRVIGDVRTALIQENMVEVTCLLGCLQHWCMNQHSDLALLHDAIECYQSLLSSFPDASEYIRSIPSLIMQDMPSDLPRRLLSAVLYFVLHCNVMQQPDNLVKLYEPMLKNLCKLEGRHFPLSGLETFSNHSLLYTPMFTDLNVTCVTSELSPSLLTTLYPMIAITDPSLLLELEMTTAHYPEVQRTQETLRAVLNDFASGGSTHEEIRSILFSGGGAGGKEVDRKVLERIAGTLVGTLALSISTLRERVVKKGTPLESKLRGILRSTLNSCIQIVVTNEQNEWLQSQVSGLVDRAITDGPVFLLIVHELFIILEEQCADKSPEVLQKLINILVEADSSSAVYSALCPMDSTIYQQLILKKVEQRKNDLCFVVDCLRLMPDNSSLLSISAQCLSSIAQKHSTSEIAAVFDNLVDASQDPFAFTILLVILTLLEKKKVPEDAWDFILCSLVSLTQMLSEAELTCNINQTVFFSLLLDVCHDVALFCESPHCSSKLSTEWKEFFQPSIQECLHSFFIKRSAPDVTAYRNHNPCLMFQHYHLSRTVSAMSPPTPPTKGVAFSELMEVVVSEFHPQQIAAYKLCLRTLDLCLLYNEEPPTSSEARIPMSLKSLQDVFNRALERVNMDVVFLEDSSELLSGYSCSTNCHTVSYILTWLLVIAAIKRCRPETRVVMVDWLKEASLFDHFLHGLFKYLAGSSARRNVFSVTLSASLERLVCSAYVEVASHLPLMLRQWHLTLDRQTSAMVSKFTTRYISPALQQTELQTLSRSKTTIGNMEVHVYTGASEVSVVYKVDEFSIELFVCLPDSYPLQPPSIREGKRVKVEPGQWRKWMLQLTIFVTNQNGSLLDGLVLWKNNLDKHFSGADDCMICFSVIHSSNYSLPKMVCRTCKKKFHSACLYKWFSSSTKSSCPLCRNIF